MLTTRQSSLAGVLGAVVLGALAVAMDGPFLLAGAGVLAFVAAGPVMPLCGLPGYMLKRMPPLGLQRAAGLFAFLGVALLLFGTIALDAAFPLEVRVVGWVSVAVFCYLGACFLAAATRQGGGGLGSGRET